MAAETMEGALEKNDFMDVFYNTFIEKLIAPVGGSDSTAAADNANHSSSKAAAAKPAGGGSSSSAAAPAAASKGAGSSSGGKADVPASTIGLIVDLLCFCVQHHAFWAKYHVLR
jgi:hypothetical protein